MRLHDGLIITLPMSSFNQFYTGADPSSFLQARAHGRAGIRGPRRGLAGRAMTSLFVSLAIMAATLRLLWQGSADKPVLPEVPAAKSAQVAVHLAVETPKPPGTYTRHWQRQAPGTTEDSTRDGITGLQLPPSPQLEKIVLNNPPLLPPFPTEHNIRAGMPRARLVEAFGAPDLSAHTLQQEQMVETYVYKQQDRATFVLMRDGNVVSTYTGRPDRRRVLPVEVPISE
jgi:hypothetical protein